MGKINKIAIRNLLLFYLSYSTKQNLHKLNLLRLTTQRIDSSNFRISNVASLGVFRYSGSLSPWNRRLQIIQLNNGIGTLINSLMFIAHLH